MDTDVYDATHCSYGVWSIDDLRVRLHVLHDTARHHNDVFRCGSKLLDSQINHLAQGALFNARINQNTTHNE
jgi:hypothetical protein